MDPKLLNIFSNPIQWCETFLRDPNNSENNLVLKSYQKEILGVTNLYRGIVLRWGRRLGKSLTLCAETLWQGAAKPYVSMINGETTKPKPIKVLIATPFETQIKLIWNMYLSLISDSPLLKELLEKIRTSDEHLIKFTNGSTITGYTIGISSSNKGTSLRGLDADVLFIDEMDAIPKEIIEEVIFPIYTGHSDSLLRVSSTPAGGKTLFYKWCQEAKDMGWFHSHYPSWHKDNDRWLSIEQAKSQGKPIHASTEFQAKMSTTESVFLREYGAEFGETENGVYKTTFIENSLVHYGPHINIEDSDLFDPGWQQTPGNIYIMGVDWNSFRNGGQVCIVELCREPTVVSFYNEYTNRENIVDFTGKFRLFYRRGIKSKHSTQRDTREEIVRWLSKHTIHFLYVDYGAGDTNIEELSLYGQQNPNLKIPEKLRVVDLGAVVEHWDPITREKVKKRNKSLMIAYSSLCLEKDVLVLPIEEDTDTRLVGQMRNYKVKNMTSRGEFSYVGDDHILDAFNLALYGYCREFSDLLTNKQIFNIIHFDDPRLNDFQQRQTIIESPEFTKKTNRYQDPENVPKFSMMPMRTNLPRIGNRTKTLGFSRGSI